MTEYPDLYDFEISDAAHALRQAVKLTVSTRCPNCECPVVPHEGDDE